MSGAESGWLRRQASRLIGDTRATAAIEGAVAAPLLITLGLGVAEFGNLLYNTSLIQSGVRDAARYLARVSDPVAAEPLAKNLALYGSITADAPARVPWWASEDITVSYRSIANWVDEDTGRNAYRAGSEIMVVRVETRIDYAGLGTLALIGRDSVEVSFAHEERVVGE